VITPPGGQPPRLAQVKRPHLVDGADQCVVGERGQREGEKKRKEKKKAGATGPAL